LSPRRYLESGTIGNPNPNKRPPPGRVAPQLAQLVDAAPDGDGWLHEIKYDGYRMNARLDRGAVKLLTRTGLD
jgi:bifunctional non-homologous end joining protein LigD